MPIIKFTSNLKRFYPDLKPVDSRATSVKGVLDEIDQLHPGLKNYIVDEQGRLRKHVNIFIGEKLINDREGLTDEIDRSSEIYIMQALSGG